MGGERALPRFTPWADTLVCPYYTDGVFAHNSIVSGIGGHQGVPQVNAKVIPTMRQHNASRTSFSTWIARRYSAISTRSSGV